MWKDFEGCVCMWVCAMHFKAKHAMTSQKNTNKPNQDAHYPNQDLQNFLNYIPNWDYVPHNNTGQCHKFSTFFQA